MQSLIYNKKYFFSESFKKIVNTTENFGYLVFFGRNLLKFKTTKGILTIPRSLLGSNELNKYFSEIPFFTQKKEYIINTKLTHIKKFAEEASEKVKNDIEENKVDENKVDEKPKNDNKEDDYYSF